MELIFATNNQHKLSEIQEIVGNKFTLTSLSQSGFTGEIPENQETLEGNALEKARFIYAETGKNCFADDTGLEVESLNGDPGVYSARYAGKENNAEENIKKLLNNLLNHTNRKAQFRTVIALIINNNEYLFEGIIKGEISSEKKGNNGFGYDSVFIPEGYSKTFAEMTSSEKNEISHRAIAIKKLSSFLKSQ